MFFLPESFWDRSGFSIKNDWVFCRNHCASSLLPSIIVVPGVLDLLSPFFPWLLKGSPAKSVKAYHPNSHIIGSTFSILSGINTCFFYFFWLDTPWYPMISQMFRGFLGGHLRPGLIQWAEPADGSVHTALLRFFQAFDKDPRGMVGASQVFTHPLVN